MESKFSYEEILNGFIKWNIEAEKNPDNFLKIEGESAEDLAKRQADALIDYIK